MGDVLPSVEHIVVDNEPYEMKSTVRVSWCEPRDNATILYSCGHCVPKGTVLCEYPNAILETSQASDATEAFEYAKFTIPNIRLEPLLCEDVVSQMVEANLCTTSGISISHDRSPRWEAGTTVFNVCDGKVLVGSIRKQFSTSDVVIDPLNPETGLRPPYYLVVGLTVANPGKQRRLRAHRVERALGRRVGPDVPVCVLTHQGYSGSPWLTVRGSTVWHVGTHIARSVDARILNGTIESISDLCYVKPFPSELSFAKSSIQRQRIHTESGSPLS